MNKIALITATLLVSLYTRAQVSENRIVSDYSKIRVATGIHVNYTVSSEKSITVTSDDAEHVKYIKTELEGNTLAIFVESGKKKNYTNMSNHKGTTINGVHLKTLEVTISGPVLTGVKASSSGEIIFANEMTTNSLELQASSSGTIKGNFKAPNLTIEASSSGDVVASIEATNVEVAASSSGDVVLEGTTDKLNVDASSSADCKLSKLKANDVVVEASSSADVSVLANQKLDAKASSSSDIVYDGAAKDVKVHESSSGSISKK